MSMKGHKTLVLLGLAVFGQQAVADSQITHEQRVDLGTVELSMGVGLLNGQAREKVYDTDDGKKISQLDWDMKQVPTLHLGLTVDPLQWLSLDLLGWTMVGNGDGHMKDYDWQSHEHADWSDYSNHPDTRVKKAWQAEFAATAWAFKRDDAALGVMAGYQRSQFGWQSRGGTYTYSDQGFRDQSGEFAAGSKGVSYKQRYDTPYIGLVGRYSLGKWALESRYKYSQWVKASDFDNHHERETTFAGRHGDKGRMQSLAMGLSYHVTPQFSVKAGVDYQRYAEAKGGTLIKDALDGDSQHVSGDSSSQSAKTILSSLAVSYNF
jgi:plasminogen activator